MPLSKQRPMKASLRVACAITLDIQRGRLKPGERLVVSRLAARYRVDRATVDKALVTLLCNGTTRSLELPSKHRRWFVADRAPAPRSPKPSQGTQAAPPGPAVTTSSKPKGRCGD
ncbi:GntR family transcriptional regulator [Streptomyces xanthochromogenes]|uniref:GntR family transcriptional regulator n=2 Tax=Streptomyces TaxID=1883 RepID=UPI0038085F55